MSVRAGTSAVIPASALDQFMEYALKANEPSKRWCARLAMWEWRRRWKPAVMSLCDVNAHGRFVLSNSECEQCLKQVHDNLSNISHRS
eukprot:3587389-Pyramimonas_sp.AAC.1